ncbi:hypothetical protein QQ045_012518 [Rhodiola kirilowii]
MGLRRDRGYCYAEAKPCTEWVLVYFKDCLCNLKDEVSFGLGLLSVTCWALAEIPQIVTNFKAKSSQGVSLMLLLTWILGDLFNLAGCALEPSTLPTQFYTALLYTVGSLILVGQVIYYDYITMWFKKSGRKDSQIVILEDEDSITKPLLSQERVDSSKAINVHIARPVPRSPAYYISARSLATSPSSFEARFPNSIGEHEKHATPSNRGSFLNQPRRVVNSVAGYGTFIAAAANLPNQTGALNRLVLQKNILNEDQSGPYGQIMGWGMAVIYISGRVPQILLNMRRGNVEGLSPLMFIFALMGNTTYILSILVRSSKWVDVKANMPWLLDAAFCVSLDLLILLQFAYYKYQKSKQNKYSVRPEARNFLA